METDFADRLQRAIQEKNAPVCVGFDPLLERLPREFLSELRAYSPRGPTVRDEPPPSSPRGHADDTNAANAFVAFGTDLIRVVAPLVPAIKINVAFFERYHTEGLRAYFELIRRAHDAGLMVIGDIKRADIGHSATQYAHAHLADGPIPGATVDAITVNPYFGFDGIRPFVDVARQTRRGLFVLVQTSNDSAEQVQGLSLSSEPRAQWNPDSSGARANDQHPEPRASARANTRNSGTIPESERSRRLKPAAQESARTLCDAVADLVQRWATAEGLVGRSGYSCIGAVVSPRDVESTRRLRAAMSNCLFLVPGFGAQGRTGEEVATCFKPDGTGAIVNASRSVIYAHQNDRYARELKSGWPRCIEAACKDFIQSIRTALRSSA